MAEPEVIGTATDTPNTESAPATDHYAGLSDQERDYIKLVDEQLGVDPAKTKTTARQRLEWNLAAEEKLNDRRKPPAKTEAPAVVEPVKKDDDEDDPRLVKVNAKIDSIIAAMNKRDSEMTAKERQTQFEQAVELEFKTYDGLTTDAKEIVRESSLLAFLTNPNANAAHVREIVRQKVAKLKNHDTERGKAYVAGKIKDRQSAGESAGGRTPATKAEKPKPDDLESGRHLKRLQVEAGQR